ncbi:purine and uridine phosphorylase [Zopfia rhizophila CBS 207.26]|uniref:Purine and uridine phosphorylase n=1 Tax=Zopfia rhizophila CBS 207.26 TaxID=1314779 RepID=A0A6A6EK87_9PEZI|nr:purine and uridine phosphorylase [Zopfia rhizophila CBS 207.26]
MDGQSPSPNASTKRLGNECYTVGWICAISAEYVAAQAFLDEKHGQPKSVLTNDTNDYTLGKVGDHYVVIAVLPDGEYGLSSAASVAKDMLHSFPHVRIGLMVGIGGGAPSQRHDIRLGDIVVSASRDGKGSVFQYDFGKTIQNQSFQATRFLNQSPTVLRTAMNGLKTEYEMNGHQLEEAINAILVKYRKLRKKYRRPELSSDRLYQSHVIHPPHVETNCAVACGDDPSKLVSRPERDEEEDSPAIHYGTIASANQLMKNALIRDTLSKEADILCFEMEAAGLMNNFPCLVIRGICDYSDSHKNKEWQGYAAMAAAAYAKDLLCRIPPDRVEAEKKIGEAIYDLQEVAEAHRDIARKQLEIQQDEVKQKLSDKQQECLQLFRLTKSTEDAIYEWFKNRVENRVQDTCMWFLEHKNFQEWLKQESGPLLVSADPGCGKSVLAKYLIDHGLPQSATICCFFFKDQDQNTVRQALCALLHQLFSKKPSLIQHAMKQFDKDGSGLINSKSSLWTILGNAVQDPQAGPVIMVLDALDECAESAFEDLMRNVENQFRSNQSGYGKLKYLLTSRPYEQIVSKFRGLLGTFPRIRIPGEEESEIISQEINHVIKYRVERLATEKDLSERVKGHLASRLVEIPHRTYLWIYLVFNDLKAKVFKMTPKGIDSTIATLSKSVNKAYKQILNKSKEPRMVRKALSIILAAGQPLTLSEINVAVNIDSTSQSMRDLDLEEEEDFKSRLRS